MLHRWPAEVLRLKVGVARNLAADLDADVAACFEAAVQAIAGIAASVNDVRIEVEPAWAVRNFEIYRYHAPMLQRSPELYDPRTLDRVRSAAGVSEIDYVRQREGLKAAGPDSRLFDQVDVVVSPTVPVAAPLVADLEAMDSAALRAYEVKYLLANTLPFSFLWWPSVSVPCGFTSAGLPVGLQISGRPGADWLVLALAAEYEQVTEWHKQAPCA